MSLQDWAEIAGNAYTAPNVTNKPVGGYGLVSQGASSLTGFAGVGYYNPQNGSAVIGFAGRDGARDVADVANPGSSGQPLQQLQAKIHAPRKLIEDGRNKCASVPADKPPILINLHKGE